MDKDEFITARKWLADAPLFIDANQVDRFFDAVASPQAKLGITKVTLDKGKGSKAGGEAGIEVQSWWGFVAGKGSARATGERSSQQGKTKEFHFEPIVTPQRQLIGLTYHYEDKCSDRAFYVDTPSDATWRDRKTILEVPRAIVFLDLPSVEEANEKGLAETRLIPMAAEYDDGEVVQIYRELKGKDGSALPEYSDKPGDMEKRKKYWAWFTDNFGSTQSMLAVEQASKGKQKMRWIDYRLPVTSNGDTVHLHFQPAGQYDTGVFAYNLIKRGYKHGLRIVGTLKSEPDINVLAVYEK